MINTPFGQAKYLGTVGINIRWDRLGFFDVTTGEYYDYK